MYSRFGRKLNALFLPCRLQHYLYRLKENQIVHYSQNDSIAQIYRFWKVTCQISRQFFSEEKSFGVNGDVVDNVT